VFVSVVGLVVVDVTVGPGTCSVLVETVVDPDAVEVETSVEVMT